MNISYIVTSLKRIREKCMTEKRISVSFFYGVIYVVLFAPILKGVGNYWDWAFPYFSDHMGSFFSNQSLAWSAVGIGSPMSYASDYFFRLVLSFFNLIQPEFVLFTLIVVACLVGSYLVYILLRERGYILAFLGGLVALINPAIFYKIVAGHLYYILAYVMCIGLIYYLIEKYKKRYVDIVVISLLLAFMGLQIQFFFFGFIILLIFFFVYKEKFSWAGLVIPFFATIAINLVWLMNFISGALQVSDVSGYALKNTFEQLVNSSFLRMVNLSFSEATLIERYFDNHLLLGFIALSLLAVVFVLYPRQKTNKERFTIAGLAVFFLLGLRGSFIFSFYPLSILFPMFREVGHVGPVFFLFLVITIVLLSRTIIRDRLVVVLLLVFIGVNSYMYVRYYPRVDFSEARNQFDSFKEVLDEDVSQYRVLSYPFFEQYSFHTIPVERSGNLNINNAGYDSFAKYAGKSFIINNVRPHEFNDSLHFDLLMTYDLNALRMLNVKYIFDFSHIYESNYHDYVTPETYNNDISLVKNDDTFLPLLLKKNPESLEQLSDYVYEITDTKPYIHAFDTLHTIDGMYQDEATSMIDSTDFYFTTDTTLDAEHTVAFDQSAFDTYIGNLKNVIKSTSSWGNVITDADIEAIYNNFSFLQKPKDISREVLFQDSSDELVLPDTITFNNTSPVKKLVHVAGAATPFYLAMSESYHDKWRLQFSHRNYISRDDHVVLNNTLNAWFVDVDEFCRQQSLCIENTDGSYDFDLEIIFTPQRWFVVGRTISFVVIFILVGYLVRYRYAKNI